MNELPRAANAVLQQAREAHDPSAQDVQRSLALLHANLSFDGELGAGAQQGVGPGAEAGSALHNGSALLGTKVAKLYLVVAALSGAVGGVVLWRTQAEPPRLTSRVAITAPITAVRDEAPRAEPAVVTPAADEPPARLHAASETSVAPARGNDAETRARRPAATSARSTTRSEARTRVEVASKPAQASQTASPTSETSSAARVDEAEAKVEPTRDVVEAAAAAQPRGPAELALIDRAATSLRDGKPDAALRALDEHLALYPGGVLATERQGLRVLALCAAGRTQQARLERSRFLLHAGSTPLASKVRRACAGASE